MALANIGENRIGERLVLLSLQGNQVLTRLYDIKKFPSEICKLVHEEKALEPVLKFLLKKFPNWESKSAPASIYIKANAGELLKDINSGVDMLRDLLEFKERALELFNVIAAGQLDFDFNINYDMCRLYMDILSLYCQIMFMLPRTTGAKILLGMYQLTLELTSGTIDSFIPRMCAIIQGFEANPYKRIQEDLSIFHKPIQQCILSLCPVLLRRIQTADQLVNSNLFNVWHNPTLMKTPTTYKTPGMEFLCIDTFAKWVLYGFMCCASSLGGNEVVHQALKAILSDQYASNLFRDETIVPAQVVEASIKAAKGPKLEKLLTEACSAAVTNSLGYHKGRREFLRSALKEWHHILNDKPALLGPKLLSMTRDEVIWYCHHQDAQVPKFAKGKVHVEDLQDTRFVDILFYQMQIMNTIRKHAHVISRYYNEFVVKNDKEAFRVNRDFLSNEGDERGCLDSISATLDCIPLDTGASSEYKPSSSMASVRLDWIRTQIFTSQTTLGFTLKKATGLCNTLHNAVLHSSLVDKLFSTVDEVADLGILAFYPQVLEAAFQDAHNTSSARYLIAIPYHCSQFCGENLRYCPEEVQYVGPQAVKSVDRYLEMIGERLGHCVFRLADDFMSLNFTLLPHNSLLMSETKSGKKTKAEQKKKAKEMDNFEAPGLESYRVRRELLSQCDEKLYAILDVCYAFNILSSIDVWKHTFVPREYAIQPLHESFMQIIFAQLEVPVTAKDKDIPEVRRPTVLLNSVKGILNMLRMLENYLNVDMVRIYNAVLLQQAQELDINGHRTICNVYSSWYNSVLLKRICSGTGFFATNRRCFMSRPKEPFQAEMYTDPSEIKALCELVGAYGIRHIGDLCVDYVVSQVNEIKKLLTTNKDLLHNIRANSDKFDLCGDWIKKLSGTEELLQRLTIVGTILNFRKLLFNAMKEVLSKRVPFVMSSVIDFKEHYTGSEKTVDQLDYLAITAGLECIVDPKLKSALVMQCDVTQQDYILWCLMLIFVAVGLPTLASNDQSVYQPALAGYENNIHCIATAVNQLSAVIFTVIGYCTVQERMHEFLAVATAHLLRLGQENEKDARQRDSIYILLHRFVEESPFLTMNLLETCFPYVVLRNSYNIAYKNAALHVKWNCKS